MRFFIFIVYEIVTETKWNMLTVYDIILMVGL